MSYMVLLCANLCVLNFLRTKVKTLNAFRKGVPNLEYCVGISGLGSNKISFSFQKTLTLKVKTLCLALNKAEKNK